MQMVLGFLLGYLFIATVLMPLYYRLKLVTIYTYLNERFGFWSYKTGAFFFLLSRVIGASFRLYVVAIVLHAFVFKPWGVPFWVITVFTLLLIWVYTFRGGMKTIIWTDTLQTLFMLLAVGISIYFIGKAMNFGFSDIVTVVKESEYSKIFYWDDWRDKKFFVKQFLGGAFIAIAMTGLDQDMMQKNLSCKNIGDAQKNMFWFSIILVIVNIVFLSLGALLYFYASSNGITLPEKSDELFPMLALQHFSSIAGAVFIIGLIAAAYSSADSAMAALTTSFYVDFLGLDKKTDVTGKFLKYRYATHLGFSFLILLCILLFHALNNRTIIDAVFSIAQYTYGPLLGIFCFGLFTRFNVRDKLVPMVCLISPIITFLINHYSAELFGEYQIAYELLIFNGMLTFAGLWFISKRKNA